MVHILSQQKVWGGSPLSVRHARGVWAAGTDDPVHRGSPRCERRESPCPSYGTGKVSRGQRLAPESIGSLGWRINQEMRTAGLFRGTGQFTGVLRRAPV